MRRTKYIRVRLTPAEKQRWDAIAKTLDRPLARIVRAAMRQVEQDYETAKSRDVLPTHERR